MKRIGFILFIIAVYPLSKLPMRVIYLLSDFLYVILYYAVKYRRDVVYTNLKKSFPEKNEEEINRITKAFYKNLCDVIIEALKMNNFSMGDINDRNVIDDFDLLEKYKAENKSVVAVVGHFGNWEWGGLSLSINSPLPVNGIYRPLSNPYFDKFMIGVRSRFGMQLVKMDDTYRILLDQKVPAITVFIADQSPPNIKSTYWTTFLSQDTPVFLGVEKIALKLNCPVVFLYSLRVKRGHYRIYCALLAENPAKLPGEHEITELHTKFLEQLIRQYPDQWLWSHRRWKHKKID